MIVGKENEVLEFKKSTSELREGINTMSAILNKHGHGTLYFGVSNDGTPIGMDISNKTLRDISQMVGNTLEPRIYPEINEVVINGKHCIHIEFSGDDAPYYAHGRAYIRVADEDRQMSAAELEKFILQKNAGRDTWDSELSSKTVEDVNEDELKKFVALANKAGRIDFEYSDRKSVLNRLDVTRGDVVSNAARALFIGFPLLEVQMAIFATKEKRTFLDIRRGTGNVRQLVEIAVKYCIDNMRWRVVLNGSVQRDEIPEIPKDAIREAITNSFCHRDYRSTQNNEIAIFSDRIEIYNPGRFPEGLTPEDFINGESRSVKRNPNIAQLMYYCKDIESFGTGLQRIARDCKEADVKVEFKELKLGFLVVFYRPKNHINSDDMDGHLAKATGRESEVQINDQLNDQKDDQINVRINDQINATEQAVLSIIGRNPRFTLDEIAKEIGKSTKTAQRYLDNLRKRGIIQRVGSRKDGRWEIIHNGRKEPRPRT